MYQFQQEQVNQYQLDADINQLRQQIAHIKQMYQQTNNPIDRNNMVNDLQYLGEALNKLLAIKNRPPVVINNNYPYNQPQQPIYNSNNFNSTPLYQSTLNYQHNTQMPATSINTNSDKFNYNNNNQVVNIPQQNNNINTNTNVIQKQPIVYAEGHEFKLFLREDIKEEDKKVRDIIFRNTTSDNTIKYKPLEDISLNIAEVNNLHEVEEQENNIIVKYNIKHGDTADNSKIKEIISKKYTNLLNILLDAYYKIKIENIILDKEELVKHYLNNVKNNKSLHIFSILENILNIDSIVEYYLYIRDENIIRHLENNHQELTSSLIVRNDSYPELFNLIEHCNSKINQDLFKLAYTNSALENVVLNICRYNVVNYIPQYIITRN